MPQLALANTFFASWEQLEKPVRAGVRKAMDKFQRLSIAELYADKGLHLESVQNARDPRMRTIRINDFWRGVVLAPDDGSDDVPAAQRRAARRRVHMGGETAVHGQHRDPGPGGPQRRRARTAHPDVGGGRRRPRRRLLFARHSDTVLRELGIDDQVLRAVRTIIDRPQLEAFGALLPEDQFEVLQYLAEGFSPGRGLPGHRRRTPPGRRRRQRPGRRSLALAIARTTSRIALVSSADELAEMLEKPFAAWRVFLHPSQRRVAYRTTYNGPVQVTGGPGTGKTVAALHRVRHLLSRSPDCRVLLTTYTKALAHSLRENLALLLDDDPTRLDRVEVTTVNAFAVRTVRELAGRVPRPIGDADERQLWRRVRRRLDLPWTEQFLAQEFRHVVLAHQIEDLAAYQKVVRRGRGTTLVGRQRERVWAAVEAFRAELRAAGATTHLQLCADAARLLADADLARHGFDHVVVDEAQDLHPAQWRVLRAAVPRGPDDLFVTGDPHQRIYDSRVSLSALGIPTAGRSFRLRINYRSTEEILSWSTRLLDGSRIDDLGGDGTLDSLVGYRSLLRGRRPDVGGYPNEQAEVAALVARVRQWLDQGVRPAEIAVCTRFNLLLGKVADALADAGIPAVRVKDQPTADVDGVRLATMHAMKGLEFRCVAVLGVTASAVPFGKEVTPAEVDPIQHATDLLRERCVLFVACTRAREALHISWSGAPSPFLPAEVTG